MALRKIPVRSNQIINYLGMINDGWRNKFFRDILQERARDKIVLDVGSGTGILGAYALEAGANFLYAVESNPESARMTEYTLGQIFDQSRFKVITGNFWTNEVDPQIDQKVDILLSETVGAGLFDQGMIQTWQCAKQFLAPDAISIPDRLHCDVHIWDHEVDFDYMLNNSNHMRNQRFPLLIPSELLFPKFAETLIDYEQILFQEKQKLKDAPIDYTQPVENNWSKVKLYNVPPTQILTDVINVTKDTLPELEFDKLPFPNNIHPKIKFSLDLPQGPNTVAIVNKISFEDRTLLLQDALYTTWELSATFVCTEPGTYEFELAPLFVKHTTPKEWVTVTWYCKKI